MIIFFIWQRLTSSMAQGQFGICYSWHGVGSLPPILDITKTYSVAFHHLPQTNCLCHKSNHIHSFGVLHLDLQLDNILWNAELGQALIIDSHCAKLDLKKLDLKKLDLKRKRERLQKGFSCVVEAQKPKQRTICQ